MSVMKRITLAVLAVFFSVATYGQTAVVVGAGSVSASSTNTFTAPQNFNGNLTLGAAVNINWTDAAILRDAANIIAHRNGTNAQGLRIYNTWTDASNGEWGTLDFTTSANVFTVGTVANGTGTGRTLQLQSSGAANPINFRTNAALRWQMTSAGHFITAVDNTQDIGASGATRPRTLFTGTSVNSPTYLTTTNCSSSAAPAVCAAAASGSVVVAAAATTVTVNTTAVTANSQIIVTEDSSLGTKLSVTCNVTPATAPPVITARTAATSFVITTTAPTTNPRCFSYTIVN